MTQEFAPEEWYGHGYASGVFLGDRGKEILGLSIARQRDVAAYFHGCPKRKLVSREYGTEWTRRRYMLCNFWYGWIVERARTLNNSDLAGDLTAAVQRFDTVGSYETGAVPKSYLHEISPMARLPNYALPRVFIAATMQMAINGERDSEQGRLQRQDRLFRVTTLLDQAIKKAKTGDELVAIFSEKLVRAKIVKPRHILGHILPYGLFEEEGGIYYFKKLGDTLSKKALRLWRAYKDLSLEEMYLDGTLDLEGYGQSGVLLFQNIEQYFAKSGKERKELKPGLDANVHSVLDQHGLKRELNERVRFKYRKIPKNVHELEAELKRAEGNNRKVIQAFTGAFGRQLLRRVDLSIAD